MPGRGHENQGERDTIKTGIDQLLEESAAIDQDTPSGIMRISDEIRALLMLDYDDEVTEICDMREIIGDAYVDPGVTGDLYGLGGPRGRKEVPQGFRLDEIDPDDK